MARLQRTKEPDGVWHLMSRGVRQTPTFLFDRERFTFLDMLDRAFCETGLVLRQHCLMTNHYHLLAEGTGRQLGDAMQLLNSQYSRQFNEWAGTNGNLFQTRFRAYRAKNDIWVVHRSIYIHLNPVVAGIVADPLDYPWSSLRDCVTGDSELKCFDPSPILRHFGSTLEEQGRNYLEHVRLMARTAQETGSLTGQLVGLSGGTGNNRMEEVQMELHETRRLKRVVEDVLTGAGLRAHRLATTTSMILSHLTQIWRVAGPDVVASVDACSIANVGRYRGLAGARLAADRHLRSLVGTIEERYRGSFWVPEEFRPGTKTA